MRLLLDEMLSAAVARALRARGHDVEAIKEHPDWSALSDAAVLEVARRERRAVVTDNLRDWRPLHQATIAPGGGGHFGMVFIPGGYRRSKADVGRIVTALAAVLTDHPRDDHLASAEAWI